LIKSKQFLRGYVILFMCIRADMYLEHQARSLLFEKF